MEGRYRRERYAARALDSQNWSAADANKAAEERAKAKAAEKAAREKEIEEEWKARGVTNLNHKNNSWWKYNLTHQIIHELTNRFIKIKMTKKEYIETPIKMFGQSPAKRRKDWEKYSDNGHQLTEYKYVPDGEYYLSDS